LEILVVVRASSLRIDKEICPGFRLNRLRGKGGFGSVWEAKTPEGKLVALKFLPCGDNTSASQEVRSIQAVRQLRHPNLIRIEQVWCHRGYVVITMELADGSLLDLLEAYKTEFGTPLVPHDICYYLSQVAQALDYLNTRQHMIEGQQVAIQHGDIKPTNLLLYGEKVKLSDFGLASVTSSTLKLHRRAGTLDYSAPEILQGRLSDWSDQFALAVTYCHLRGGVLPFRDTPGSFKRDYVRPAPDLSMLSSKEQPIIARALSPIPQDRWPSCTHLMNLLKKTL
jgi:serine/threonine protein kinase